MTRKSGVTRRNLLLALLGGGGGLALLYGNHSGDAPFLGGGGDVGPTPSSELLIETGETYRIGADESETHLGLRNEIDSELEIAAGGEITLEAI